MEESSGKKTNGRGIFLAVIAAICYSISSPLSKLLLDYLSPTLMAGFLYLGAGLCMIIIFIFKKILKKKSNESIEEKKLTKKDLPYIVFMVLLDIAAPILMMLGLSMTTASNASLLNNFEIVATSLIAFTLFKGKISLRLWIGIVVITLSCLVLTFEDFEAFNFSIGSLFILLATICWGFENNCTRKISTSDPLEIVLIKGLFSGLGSLIIGFSIGERIVIENVWAPFAALLIGIVAYGLSIFFYIYAQRFIGAAKTSAYYAINPFVAAIFSLILFLEVPTYQYYIALALMIIGAFLASSDKPLFKKKENKI